MPYTDRGGENIMLSTISIFHGAWNMKKVTIWRLFEYFFLPFQVLDGWNYRLVVDCRHHHRYHHSHICWSFHHPKRSKSSQMVKIIPNGQNDGLVVDIAAATTICPKSPKSSGTLVLEMARMSFTWFSFCQISLLRGFFIKLARIVQIHYFG